MKRYLLFFVCAMLIDCSYIQQQDSFEKHPNTPLFRQISSIAGIEIEPLGSDSIYTEKYKIMINQPLDHDHPEVGSFQQLVYLFHRDFDAPTVLITEGYAAQHNYCHELAELLNANEIRVEHRFFGKSKPDSMNWQYLNIKQAATDHHKIVSRFKQIYKDKWISTGWSKGGQTAIFHRYFYPNDIDASVIYDSPLNFELEDVRIDLFFETVGTKEIRSELINFQRLALLRKDNILPLFDWYTRGKGYTFSIGIEKAYEYIVLEYPFSFWQYHTLPPDSIPADNATDDEILKHLKKIVSFSSYADRSMNSPSMFQFSTELGYYGYVIKNVKALLSDVDYPNFAFAPQVSELEFNPEPMQRINQWLQEKGHNFIYLYGENDPWSAPAIDISAAVNSKKYYLEEGNHFTFIRDYPADKQKEIIRQLENWLK